MHHRAQRVPRQKSGRSRDKDVGGLSRATLDGAAPSRLADPGRSRSLLLTARRMNAEIRRSVALSIGGF
jgi:hypothetical protein